MSASTVIGSGTYGPIKMLLKGAGVDPEKDVKLIEIGFALSEEALRQGRVDAVNMNQPFAARMEAKGGTRKLFSLSKRCRTSCTSSKPAAPTSSTRIRNWPRYVADITLGMKKALANREETLKVVNEVMKAPIPVLETYLLKDNDFARGPGRSAELPAMQKMLDIYVEAGMLPKMDAMQFKHPTIVAPIQ
jgi:hypothetical protein